MSVRADVDAGAEGAQRHARLDRRRIDHSASEVDAGFAGGKPQARLDLGKMSKVGEDRAEIPPSRSSEPIRSKALV